MGQGIFTIVLLENQWKFRFHGKHSVPYANQKEAIVAAIAAAYAEGKKIPMAPRFESKAPITRFAQSGPTEAIHIHRRLD